ncbi:MAG: hypothetical protein OXR73_38520 [Myxococcales bacterium]|nr:hypothetical protein [Myxococcales bacterium]
MGLSTDRLQAAIERRLAPRKEGDSDNPYERIEHQLLEMQERLQDIQDDRSQKNLEKRLEKYAESVPGELARALAAAVSRAVAAAVVEELTTKARVVVTAGSDTLEGKIE